MYNTPKHKKSRVHHINSIHEWQRCLKTRFDHVLKAAESRSDASCPGADDSPQHVVVCSLRNRKVVDFDEANVRNWNQV